MSCPGASDGEILNPTVRLCTYTSAEIHVHLEHTVYIKNCMLYRAIEILSFFYSFHLEQYPKYRPDVALVFVCLVLLRMELREKRRVKAAPFLNLLTRRDVTWVPPV